MSKKKSIEFANWLHFNYDPHANERCWYDHHSNNKTPLPTKKLYKIWKKTKMNDSNKVTFK